MLLTSDYATLTQKLNDWYNEAAAGGVEEWVGKGLFNVIDTDWQVYNHLTIYGTGAFEDVAEGGQLPVVTSQEGDSVTATQRRRGGRVSITKDMRMFERYDQMKAVIQSAVDYAFNRIDQSMADLLLYGMSGTSYTDLYGKTQSSAAADGVALFSASHSNNLNSDVVSNLIVNTAGHTNPAVSRDAIQKTIAASKVYKDPNDVNRPIYLDTIIFTPTNEDLVNRLVLSEGVGGTPNVDINPIKGKIKNLISWAKLETSSVVTSSSAYWFMADSKKIKDSLLAPFAQKPMMAGATQVHDSLNWEYPIDAYYVLQAAWPFGIRGCTGAGS